MTQRLLLCGCGALIRRGPCRRCARRARLSRERFAGARERVLQRDEARCQVCGSFDDVLVHHRLPGSNAAGRMVTLCRRCHARVHRLGRLRYGLPDALLKLWREVHPHAPRQLELELGGTRRAGTQAGFEF